ncbi:MAG: hypothetical protein ACFFDI_10750 [Promethearchaeota archaeon]
MAPSKLGRLDTQKRETERMLINMVFGAIAGAMIGFAFTLLTNIWVLWIWCMEIGFGVGVASSARFRVKSYCYMLFGMIVGLGLGAVVYSLGLSANASTFPWGAFWYVFSPLFWYTYFYGLSFVFMGAGIVFGLLLGIREVRISY